MIAGGGSAPLTVAPAAEPYPVRLEIDYPESLDRVSTALRIFWIIPILVVYLLVSGATSGDWGDDGSQSTAAAGGLLVAPTVLMLLFRRKYPRWWFDFNRELSRFGARLTSYALLQRDEYPSTDEEQAVHLEIDYPDAMQLNRFLPLVKWLLALPHYLVLLFLGIAAFFVVVVAWFAILVTGRYPRSLFDFIVGVQRWANRVGGYMALLVTDRYPPFSLR